MTTAMREKEANFEGYAIVSFQTEEIKNVVLNNFTHDK